MPGTPTNASPAEKIAPDTPLPDKVSEASIPDTARYQEQLIKLILFHDERALKLLSLYVPVMVAIATAAVALNQNGKLTLYIELFLGFTDITLFVGCLWAYGAAWTAPIYLPGRKPDFWIWAIENDVDFRGTALAYLKQSIDTTQANETLGNRAADQVANAYACGLAAPLLGAASVWLAYWYGN
jgi:hypothetical protein